MYRMKGRDEAVCRKCKRPSCIYPKVCPNLNTDHRPLLDIYHAVDALPGIKKSFIGSGVRYDLLLHQSKDPNTNKSTQEYTHCPPCQRSPEGSTGAYVRPRAQHHAQASVQPVR